MTCPVCRNNLLKLLSRVRKEKDFAKLKRLQKAYLIYVRKGNWKLEGSQILYCINQGVFTQLKSACCYHLTYKERIEYSREQNRLSEDQYRLKLRYALLRDHYSEEESCEILAEFYKKSGVHYLRRKVHSP